MKNKSFIEFEINKEKKIVINFFEPLLGVCGCFHITVTFVDGKEQFLMAEDVASYLLKELIFSLKKALNNKLVLHNSISNKIGYLWIQYCFYSFNKNFLKRHLVLDKDGWWIGGQHLLWAYDLGMWLYNNDKEEIVLEITPLYKGPSVEDGGYALYEKFLNEYKTCCVIKLPKELIGQWLDKAEKVLAILEENTRLQHIDTTC